MIRQQLQEELKNVPVDASQVHCSTTCSLNKEETLSVSGSNISLGYGKLSCNNPEVNPAEQTPRSLKAFVFVLDMNGNPLMPCSFAKSKRLCRRGAAVVVKAYPYVIQLTCNVGSNTQKITMGMDSGAKNIGISVLSEKQEFVSQEVTLDKKTHGRLMERTMYRRGRRTRHHWYRKPRFNNRKRKTGWLPPSIMRSYQTHLNLIKFWKKYLPITNVVVETAKFDIQKLENPDISGTEYQQGNLADYDNTKSFVLFRERIVCQLCGKSVHGTKFNLHHIIPRSQGGTDKPDNLALLHETCHDNLHKKNLYTKLKRNKQYKESTFMNIIRKKFYDDVPDMRVTYGYITHRKRCELGFPKTHYNDAFVIGDGISQGRATPVFLVQKHRNNRVLQLNRNGYKPAIRRQRYKVQPYDLCWVDGVCKQTTGIQNKGQYLLIDKKAISVNRVSKVYHFGSFYYNVNNFGNSSPRKRWGFLAA